MYSNSPGPFGTRKNPYDMSTQLAIEDSNKENVAMLFMGHKVEDISSLREHRKSGTDFLLHPFLNDGCFGAAIRCENKFERKLTGNTAEEFISVDRGNFTPGWLVTSSAAWLLHWFLSGELVAMHMDELRQFLFSNPARFGATTARNRTYLSWNMLVPVNDLVKNLESARVVDYGRELGWPASDNQLFNTQSRQKLCDSDELVRHMQGYAGCSTPLQLGAQELQALARQLAPRDRMRSHNADMLAALPWLRTK